MNTPGPVDAGAAGQTRRVWLAAALLGGVDRNAWAATAALPSARSLRDELALALKGGNPLVVLVSLAGCPFCNIAREHYLVPMRAQQGLPVVQVDMRSAASVLDFHGTVVAHEQLVRAWDIAVAPTVLFFGRAGAEVAPRLVGGGAADFYGAYLDQRLAQARAVLKTV